MGIALLERHSTVIYEILGPPPMATRSFVTSLTYLSTLGVFALLGSIIAVFRPSFSTNEDLLED